jgi:hypothetical protein
MSNPTEFGTNNLPDERAEFESAQRKYHLPLAEADLRQDKIGNYYNHVTQANWSMWQARAALARRAQTEGEAPQADNVTRSDLLLALQAALGTCQTKSGVPRMSHLETLNALNAAIDAATRAATLSPLCGAQHAESGKEVAAKPPFPISDDEMAALRRFWECATDGEGYDVEKSMMQRLAEMGLVQRKSGAYYMSTEFGLYVLGEYTIDSAAQLDGGQEGSESNG